MAKLRRILSGAAAKASGSEYVDYREAVTALRCVAMGFFWTFDNLNYLTVTETVNFGVPRAQKGFSRSWSVGSALLILLGMDALRRVSYALLRSTSVAQVIRFTMWRGRSFTCWNHVEHYSSVRPGQCAAQANVDKRRKRERSRYLGEVQSI